jgi:metal-responsive CopG/Arc/MetJ family transcriptional regulator
MESTCERPRPRPVAVTLPEELLEQIDRRARQVDLNRSQYFRRLARADIEAARSEAAQEVAR